MGITPKVTNIGLPRTMMNPQNAMSYKTLYAKLKTVKIPLLAYTNENKYLVWLNSYQIV